MKKTLIFIVSYLFIFSPVPALAAKNVKLSSKTPVTLNSTSQIGNDISWPQCNKALPKGQAFAIVGVNDGLANTTNPCFNYELNWAQSSSGNTNQAKASLYVNSANPGNLNVADWPKNNYDPLSGNTDIDPYGVCNGEDSSSCAYQYGHNMAEIDAQNRISPNNPANFKWWIDVETDNSWESNTIHNAADIDGMISYFKSIGSNVGIYSSQSQWQQIVGVLNSSSPLYGLSSWLAGSTNLAAAEKACSLPGFSGGQTSLTQYVYKQIDYDYSC